MKERPLIFAPESVRAILAGTKTQTRRIVKPQPSVTTPSDAAWRDASADLWRNAQQYARDCSPYGGPGDRLWVREGWGVYPGSLDHERIAMFRADSPLHVLDWPSRRGPIEDFVRWRSPIHMPRWASRITLEVLAVRLQRLQEISEEDAIAEGTERSERTGGYLPGNCAYAQWAFHELWDSINARRAPWESNPWVWVIEFTMGKAIVE